jgi:hypothetical protein
LAWTTEADAIVKGRESSYGYQVLRVSSRSGARCSGVAIGQALVVTAAHCGARAVHVNGRSIAASSLVRSAVLDDGRHASVSGDAIILKLSAPLPPSISPLPIGEGDGDRYTIAGYGTIDERRRGSTGALHEATLMAVGRYALVDPNRDASIGASACFGDSGGAVLRGGTLVGVISRASHPLPHIACGHVTRWAPIVVSGDAQATNAMSNNDNDTIETTRRLHVKRLKRRRI